MKKIIALICLPVVVLLYQNCSDQFHVLGSSALHSELCSPESKITTRPTTILKRSLNGCDPGVRLNPNTNNYQILIGKFKHLIVELKNKEHEEEEYIFITNDGDLVHLVFDDPFQKNLLPLYVEIELAVNEIKPDTYSVFAVDNLPLFYRLDECSNIVLKRLNETNKDVGLYRIVHPDAEITPTMIDSLNNTASQIESFFQTIARNRWTVSVSAYYVPTICTSSGPPSGCLAQINSFKNENNISHTYTAVWGGSSPTACGHAYIGGTESWTYLNYNCGLGTLIHELGHNFGLHHAGSINASGNISEYGDYTSSMGNSRPPKLFNSPNLIYLNMHDDTKFTEITSNRRLDLVPIERSFSSVGSGKYQHAGIRRTHENKVFQYFISTRDHTSPFPVHSMYKDNLFIHTLERNSNTNFRRNKSLLVRRMNPGTEYTIDESHIKVRYHGINNDVADVEVTFLTPSFCGVNYYMNNSSCVFVGNGHFSPNQNNTRFACTNKPQNSNYRGPGQDGTNNCPWACNNGFSQSGNQCVSNSPTPPPQSGCGINQYRLNNSCSNVGSGFFSPNNDNNRYHCTNKPDYSVYTGSGQNGENSCPWECEDGMEEVGGQCILICI